MQLNEVLKTGQAALVTVSPDTLLVEAAKTLRDNGIGVLVAVDAKGEPAGILSERDVSRAVAENCNDNCGALSSAKVSDYMSPDVVVCEVSEDPQTAIWLMAEYGIRHLPITNRGKLHGMVSSRDVLKVMADMPVFDQETREQPSIAL